MAKRMRWLSLLMAALLVPPISGCAAVGAGSPLAQQVHERPLPASEAERAAECDWIRRTMEREQDIYDRETATVRGLMAVLARVRLEENLTVLWSRATAARCTDDLRYARCGYHPLCWPY